MKYEKQLQRIVDYIKAGEKPVSRFTLGVEMENFIVNKDNLETVSYYGKNGVGETLAVLSKEGYDVYKEEEYILGLEKDPITVSTEPGSQFEIAIKSNYEIDSLEKEYIKFFKNLINILDKNNQMVVPIGYHPNMKIEDIKILPKERYGHMYRYFKTNGTMGHNMMKGTASLQVTIDYKDEKDFSKKYRVLNAMTPIMYAMFDNAYIFEKEPLESYNIRQKIWENTDPERSGIYEFSLDEEITYEKYAKKILDTPIIFEDINGKTEYTGDKKFKDLFDPEKDGDDKIFHALSIVFPDIRVKRYIEIRMMDAVRYPLNFSCVALIKGLMYDENNLEKISDMFKNYSYRDVLKGKIETEKLGLEGMYKNRKIKDISLELIDMAENVLDEKEQKYLQPLKELIIKGKSPRDVFKNIYEEKGLREAVNNNALTMEVLDV